MPRLAACLTLCVLFSLPGATPAAEPPREPILRIEAGMHTNKIGRIDVDAEGRYLVTGSYDKTVRVWELATGRLLRILRSPIGTAQEGRIEAVALSPDGRTVATGGWTGDEWDTTYSIYLFDRESGRLVRRLPGIPKIVFHLAYSPDGRWLAATLGGRDGVRLYRTVDWTLVAEDRAYGGRSESAHFDAQGRLVTVSDDGFVRLYAGGTEPASPLRLVAKHQVPGGAIPFSVAFSPDGARVAVGYTHSTRIDVLSGADLTPLFAPDTRGVDHRDNLASVVWSADGRFLYAGGTHKRSGSRLVRRWGEAGRGAVEDFPVAHDTIMDLRPLKHGGVVVGTGDPLWAAFDAANRRTHDREAPIADYRGKQGNFLVSPDGETLRFWYLDGGRAPARFSVESRLLTLDPGVDSALVGPVAGAGGLEVRDWLNTYTPTLAGRALPLERYETSRSVAITPDQQSFLLGTEWSLRLFDRTGAQRWRVSVSGVAWTVNVVPNGALAVAALGDGTIRWYRLRDGQELLAFFPHADRKRWVLWTPGGYYDASPGGEDLIGWHINNGPDAAGDFFSASRFRTARYRPDVVAKVLETRDEAEAVRRADAEAGRKPQALELRKLLPPVVEIETPADGTGVTTPEVMVTVRLRTPSGEPVTELKATVDGRPVATERGITTVPADGMLREVRVPVPERDAELAIVAENRHAVSEPAAIRLKWRGAVGPFQVPPRLYVLAIGVSQYADPALRLNFAAKDAQDFAAALEAQRGKLYRDVTARVLTDGQATKDAVLDGLEWLERQTTSKDVAVLFLAGHGVNDPNGAYYFLPVNVRTDALRRTGVPFVELKQTVGALAGKTVMFVDTCHSGNVMGARRGPADITQVVNELASAETGAVVFASSTGRQYALEHADWRNGAFTKALVEGLAGAADFRRTGRITVNMLDLYVSERVKELTQGQQTPATTKPATVPDFPLAIKP
jgi:WD40 repeat protein